METKLITSETNAIIKHVKSLSLKKQRTKHMQFTVEGLRIIEECIKYDGDIEYVIYSEDLHKTQGGLDLLDKISSKGHTVYEVPSGLFSKLATTESPQGIMAIVNMKDMNLSSLDLKNDGNLFFVNKRYHC